MSKTGVCKFFNGEKGFGFIVQDDGGEDIFVHRNQCSDGQNPNEGDALTYDVDWDDRKGKNHATNVTGGTGGDIDWALVAGSRTCLARTHTRQMPDADAARCLQQITEADAACGCDCGEKKVAEDADEDEDEGQGQGQAQGEGEGEDQGDFFSCCECKCCGILGQGCTVPCSELLRIGVAEERGKDCSILTRRMSTELDLQHLAKENPKLCGDCRDHGLLDLRLKAVQRMHSRKRKRSPENDEDQPMANRTHNAAAAFVF